MGQTLPPYSDTPRHIRAARHPPYGPPHLTGCIACSILRLWSLPGDRKQLGMVVVLRASLCVLILLAALGAARGAPVLELSGIPSTFVPGESVTFDVLLADATDLASYNVVLTLDLTAGMVGTDAYFVAPTAPVSRYVFGADTAYFAATVLTVGATQFLTLSDFHDPDGDGTLEGVNTVAGANDRIATVTIATQAGLCGDLRLSFDASALELDTPSLGAPVPIDGFAALQSSLAAQGPVGVTAIPEPATLSLAVLAFIAAVAGRCRTSGRPDATRRR